MEVPDSKMNEALRQELVAMRAEDMRVRQELVDNGELGGAYIPRMEAVHVANAARLRELVAEHGWPAEDIAGEDGAKAAGFIVQHSVGEPQFQRSALAWMQAGAAEKRMPAWHAAYLEDRIAFEDHAGVALLDIRYPRMRVHRQRHSGFLAEPHCIPAGRGIDQ